MSRFTCVNLEFKDAELLKSALKELGFNTIEVHKEAQPLLGFQGDERAERANIIIRRQYVGMASNDIGFAKNGKGSYDMVISEFDRNKKVFTEQLPQTYGVMAVKKQMKRRGYTMTSQKTDAKGRVKMRIIVP